MTDQKIKNGDMPAMPQDYTLWCDGIGICPTLGTGLTKREQFAMAAMQGLIAADHSDGSKKMDESDVALMAASYADALLNELEQNND